MPSSIDARGRLVYHGRIDDQVKIRGYRIELGEIEMLIADEPGVKTAAVVVHQHPAAGDMLVAHVVTNGADFDVEAAKRSLAAKLPAYMVPSIWRTHAELPRLASGKVDRKGLARLPMVVEAQAGVQEAPSSVTEAHLLAAAKSVFGLPVIDFDADFFTDLGGHSMIAARFVSEVRKVPTLARRFAARPLFRTQPAQAGGDARRARRKHHARAGGQFVRAGAAAAALPVRSGAGGGAAVHHCDRHGAMDRIAACPRSSSYATALRYGWKY